MRLVEEMYLSRQGPEDHYVGFATGRSLSYQIVGRLRTLPLERFLRRPLWLIVGCLAYQMFLGAMLPYLTVAPTC
jgi:hypothetical protein